MAAKPKNFGQRVEVVRANSDDAIAAEIESVVSSSVLDPSTAAAAIILPDLRDLTTLVGVAMALEKDHSWLAPRATVFGTRGGDVVTFGLSRAIPIVGGLTATIPSEALVLGDFPDFPETRRAPVTALEIFVGMPPVTDPKTKKPPARANLAHVDIKTVGDGVHANMWKKSISGRLASLQNNDDPRAKARVAFVVPLSLAKTLGCAP
jgi:hypothetical protein